MASYRFCRSDDIPLLVQAHNECYGMHFPADPPMTVETFKAGIRESELWTSSCMVALDGDDLIAVLLAAKRETESLIYRIAVHPNYVRHEHGRHLLTSLSAKMAILGPPRLTAEVPREWTVARSFLEACGYREEREYTDFVLRSPTADVEPSDLPVPITLDELLANDAFDMDASRCWERAPAALVKRSERLQGLAVVSDSRVEAYLLYEEPRIGEERRIEAFDCADEKRRELWLGLLFRQYAATAARPIHISKVHPGEISFEALRSWGFEPNGTTVGYEAMAVRE